MDKMRMESVDMTAQNIDKIGALFPNCITETVDENGKPKKAINFKLLRQMLSGDVVDGDEAYEFTWVGKKASIVEANKPIRKTLRPYKEESVNWDTTKNLYIEGDNLEVLKLLQESYLNKVKMIYIDPPYNTGNDFIYQDDFKMDSDEYKEQLGVFDDEDNRLFRNTDTNGRFHSDWCSMIYSRLMLARNLLSDDGIIFISIDDNEIDSLRKICDEIFSRSNFVGILSIENNPKGRKNSDFISVSSEYCVIYAKYKSKSYFIENVPKKASDMKMDENGNFVHSSGKRVLVGENGFNGYVVKRESDKNYSVYYRANDRALVIRKEDFSEVDYNLISEGYIKYSSFYNGKLVENTYTESKFYELFEQQALEFSKDKIYEKNFSDTIRIKSQLVNRKYEAIVRGKKQEYSMELTTTGAGTYLKNLFGVKDSPFSAPKNIGFLKLLISLFEKDEFIVLDFFAGSATAADAVLQLNCEDGGNRKFIMVQLPENLDESFKNANSVPEKQTIKSAISICDNLKKSHLLSEIGKERIRRAGAKIKEESPLTTQDLDVGFRVLKLDESNMNDVYYSADEYQQNMLSMLESNVKADRTDLDLLFGCLLEWGLPLSLPYFSEKIEGCAVHTYGVNQEEAMDIIGELSSGQKPIDKIPLIACFDESIPDSVMKEIARRQPLRAVFRDSSFASSPSKINVGEIFKMLAPDTRIKVI